MHLLFLLAAVSSLLAHVGGFAPTTTGCMTNVGHNLKVEEAKFTTLTTRLHSTDDKQAEIAALEEQLRQLKDETTAADKEEESTLVLPDKPDELEGESDDSIMFSERWKEAKEGYLKKEEENTMGGIVKGALAIGAVVFLGFFSQLPVGQESLQRYQDVKGNPSRIDLGDLNSVQ